ncbi:MAG: hypothetical protein O7I93_13550 [Gemmatimonadetes bacterium]|nr:hypothetical protein [Gemmatimonadota bacterium]
MEMTLKRWLGTAAAGCLVVLTGALLQPEWEPWVRPERPKTEERISADSVGGELADANFRLAAAERREAILADLERGQPSDLAPVLLADSAFPAALRELLEDAVRSLADELAKRTPHARLVVDVRLDDSLDYRRGVWNMLPYATDGTNCIVWATADHEEIDALERGVTPTTVLERWLDPYSGKGTAVARGACAFYAAFGTPGPHVKSWLELWNYAFADLADWDMPAAERNNEFAAAELDHVLTNIGRYWGEDGSLDMLACATGRARECRDLLLAPRHDLDRYGYWYRSRAGAVPGLLTPSRSLIFGPPTAHFLSDVVREIGRDGFEKFWTSELPVDSAFSIAVGRHLGEWTADWVATQVGRPEVGPGVGFGGVVSVILIGVIASAIGASVAQRRKGGV